jgi:hopanoid biosynthesis associated protein HpnK
VNRLVLTADDLGIAVSTNNAILRAFHEGVLTRCSLMVVGPARDHAVELVRSREPRIPVGLHLSLTSGRPISPPQTIPDLVDGGGLLTRGFGALWRLSAWGGAAVREQIHREVAAQFDAFASTGLRLAHVDGHRHVHMIPRVFEIVADQARAHQCPEIRLSREPAPRWSRRCREWWAHPGRFLDVLPNLPKRGLLAWFAGRARRHLRGLATTDRVYGILDSGWMTRERLLQLIDDCPQGVSEFIVHPGLNPPVCPETLDLGDCRFLRSPAREAELRALIAPELRSKLHTWQVRRDGGNPSGPALGSQSVE